MDENFLKFLQATEGIRGGEGIEKQGIDQVLIQLREVEPDFTCSLPFTLLS